MLEINNVQNYDSFLFRIIFKDDQIDVIKSGNYTDDVNALAIEGIIEEYFSANGINYMGGEN